METGHVKNVANFETAIFVLTALGRSYNPNQGLILLTALQVKLMEFKAALANVDTKDAEYRVETDEVQAEFDGLTAYVVNVKRTAEVEINDPAFTADLQTVVNKFFPKGRNTGLDDDPLTPDIDESRTARSTSERSRDKLIAHLSDIIALLETKASLYNTNDLAYTLDAIKAKRDRLTARNNASKQALIAKANAEDARDNLLYNEETGIITLVKLIKTELARNPGKNSTAYQQINALVFRKPSK